MAGLPVGAPRGDAPMQMEVEPMQEGAGMRAFSGILGGAPVPPPMAHVPLRPGTGYGGAGDSSVGTRGARLC